MDFQAKLTKCIKRYFIFIMLNEEKSADISLFFYVKKLFEFKQKIKKN